MLTYPLLTITDTTVTPLNFTGDIVFSYRFESMCTSFDHDASSTTFTGGLVILGAVHAELYTSGSLSSTLTEPMDALSFTVVNGVFDTVASTGSALLTGTFTDIPLSDELSATSLHATLELQDLSLCGVWVFGTVSGDLTVFPDPRTVTASPRPFELQVGASCL